MRISIIFLAVFVVFLLAGCDKALGPVIFNDTDHALEILAVFSDGASQTRLDPHQAYWQLKKGRVLESLVIVDNGRRREIGSGVLQPMLRTVSTSDDLLLLVRADSIDVRSLAEAQKQKFFDKR